MAFIRLPGVTGKVFVPEDSAMRPRKHDCSDCYSCQLCSDDRCSLCRAQKSCHGKKRRRPAPR
jgi:hypothetical protein